MTIPTRVSFNIPEAFKEAFGIYARFPVFFLGDAKPGTAKPIKEPEWIIPEQKSAFGLGGDNYHVAPSGALLWDRFALKHPDFADENDAYFHLPIVTTVEITETKNIVLTPLIGQQNGTVKEIMSLGDYVLTFRGLIINFENVNEYPVKQIAALKKLYEINASLPIISKLLNNAHGITDITFTGRNFGSMPGYANVAPFEFTALSDNNILIDLSNGNV